MKKQIARKKLTLTTETVRQIGDSSLVDAVGGNVQSNNTQYGVNPCEITKYCTVAFVTAVC